MLNRCAIYPPELCRAIVKGLNQQLQHDSKALQHLTTTPALAMDDDEDPDDDQWVAYDDAKGGELQVPLVREARQEEMRFVRDRNIYSYSTVKECLAETGRAPVGTKWVDTNKGDDQNPKYRSRLVATEVRKPWSEKWFAATPPIEALRLIVALAARGSSGPASATAAGTEQPQAARPQRILLLDVSRAHW